MKWTPRIAAAWAVGLLLAAARAGGQAPTLAPTLVFSDQAIQAKGMSAGGSVVWFGIGSEVREYAETLSEHQDVTVADAQGQSILDVSPTVPRRSLWVAVDLETGLFALAAPPAFPVR